MIDLNEVGRRLYCLIRDRRLTVDPKIRNNPRACAELIETFVHDNLPKCIPQKIKEYEKSSSAKSLADCSCYDKDDLYYAFDLKTHNINKWGMPNIVSYKKLDKFYKDEKNIFVIILVDYLVDDDGVIIPRCAIAGPIESIDWKYLAVQGTLGQIQIINAERPGLRSYYPDRDQWMSEFYNQVQIGINKKIRLLTEELKYFAVSA